MQRLPHEQLEKNAELAKSLIEIEKVLEGLLLGGYAVWTDGTLYYARQLVDRIKGLKIEVYANEHPPPHFHVKGCGVDAAFTLNDCSLVKSDLDGRDMALVKWWYERSRPVLIEVWNSTRPTGCTVGEFHE